ncbi:hypothetical protein phiOC_p289 [Ochrobactrum phage vB_OspM_OC]|nr:hypothetical protein phiOC_p289 [Ochrobactrum phage vB_OspM_OC]
MRTERIFSTTHTIVLPVLFDMIIRTFSRQRLRYRPDKVIRQLVFLENGALGETRTPIDAIASNYGY